MNITYRVKNVYGNDLRYVADENVAQSLQILTGRKTLLESDISALMSLGHTFERIM